MAVRWNLQVIVEELIRKEIVESFSVELVLETIVKKLDWLGHLHSYWFQLGKADPGNNQSML